MNWHIINFNNRYIMKKTFLILVTVMMAGLAAHANVTINSTNFPDANFRRNSFSHIKKHWSHGAPVQ